MLKKEIGIKQTGQDEYSYLAGGPPWAVPLVLIPVDALHEGQKYSVERGKKYLARLKQLTKDDVALWRDKIDKFGGTELDAAVNIILLDDFFSKEQFQRDKFKAAVERQDDKKPTAEKPVEPAAKQEKGEDKEIVTAWGKEVGGLQAGLGFRPGEKRAYRHGETVTLVVRVRNVGKETVNVRVRQAVLGREPARRDGRRRQGCPPGRNQSMLGFHVPVKVTLEPGKEVELESRMHGASGIPYELRPASDGAKPLPTRQSVAPLRGDREGQHSVRAGVRRTPRRGASRLDPTLSKLATGKLELEIKSDPPPAATEKK